MTCTIIQFNLPFEESTRATVLQENLEQTALMIEKQERPIVCQSC
jgi:hypothetical protein